jgi:uncharacterized membrane protein (DUF106 family)
VFENKYLFMSFVGMYFLCSGAVKEAMDRALATKAAQVAARQEVVKKR